MQVASNRIRVAAWCKMYLCVAVTAGTGGAEHYGMARASYPPDAQATQLQVRT